MFMTSVKRCLICRATLNEVREIINFTYLFIRYKTISSGEKSVIIV